MPRPLNVSPAITVLGPGQMGLVCAGLLAKADHPTSPCIRLWGHSASDIHDLPRTRRSPRLEGFHLPDEVEVTTDDREAVAEAGLIVSAVPVQHIRSVWERLARFVAPTASILSVAKGIENETLLRPTHVIADVLGPAPRRYACLSGPTIAAELARCLPAAMIAASEDPAFAKHIQTLFGNTWMRIYTNTDMLGVELAGAVKNIIAIAAGIVDGLQAGNNAKSALLARGLAEITRLGLAMGAQPETFFGIAGVGDLATTCFSPEGRNRSCGEALGRGMPLDEYLRGSPYVVEGVATTKSVMELAKQQGVDMPITAAVHAVLFEGIDPIEAIGRLMSRGVGAERVG